jgi:hypothetical protein
MEDEYLKFPNLFEEGKAPTRVEFFSLFCLFFLFGFNLKSEIVVISKHFNVLANKMRRRKKKESTRECQFHPATKKQ